MPRRVKRAQTTTWKTILLHPAVWFVVATIMLIFTATSLWNGHRDHLLVDSHYTITSNNIQVNSAPEWFEDSLNDTVSQIVNSNSSLLDPNIVPETYDYLASRPWIREVARVEKSKSGIEIDLEFRNPVAFVDLDRNTGIPVDAEGVVLDRKLFNETRYRILREELLRISLRQLRKTDSTIPWQLWRDSRLPFATTLCQFLEPFKNDLELFRVVSYDLPNSKSSPRLQIWTWNGTGVIWGSAPGHELSGEATAEAKILALKSFVDTQGKLTNFEQKGILDIDVSTGRAILVNSARRAERDDFRNKILK